VGTNRRWSTPPIFKLTHYPARDLALLARAAEGRPGWQQGVGLSRLHLRGQAARLLGWAARRSRRAVRRRGARSHPAGARCDGGCRRGSCDVGARERKAGGAVRLRGADWRRNGAVCADRRLSGGREADCGAAGGVARPLSLRFRGAQIEAVEVRALNLQPPRPERGARGFGAVREHPAGLSRDFRFPKAPFVSISCRRPRLAACDAGAPPGFNWGYYWGRDIAPPIMLPK
jgi:hypothetical protein